MIRKTCRLPGSGPAGALPPAIGAVAVAALCALATAAGCGDAPSVGTSERSRLSPVATVERFSAALEARDVAAAERLLAPDPRLWWEKKEGAGTPWRIDRPGRWSRWDEFFRSESERGPWHEEDDRVWADVEEINDWMRLTERGPSRYRLTYFLDDRGRIAGRMIAAHPHDPASRETYERFKDWARRTESEELEYLMPDGRIDPTADRPERFRSLLLRWRDAEGLPEPP